MKTKQLTLIPRNYAEWIRLGNAKGAKIKAWFASFLVRFLARKTVDEDCQLMLTFS